MHARRDLIEACGATAIFVAFDEPEQLRTKLLAGLEPAFPIAIDRDRVVYRRWGLERAPSWRIFLDPAVWIAYARKLAAGERWRGAGEDPLQLGGDFIIGPEGRIVYARPQRRDDRPPVAELLAVLRRLRRRGDS